MANIRVSCPTCKAELEIGEEHLGKEVECGSCMQAFVAEEPRGKTQECPFCASVLPAKAKKCRHCGETLDVALRAAQEASREAKEARRDNGSGNGNQQVVINQSDDYGPSRVRGGAENGLAVASLILGILAYPLLCFCWPISIPVSLGGAVCGLIGMQKAEGKGMALAGILLNAVFLILLGILFALGFGLNMVNLNRGR